MRMTRRQLTGFFIQIGLLAVTICMLSYRFDFMDMGDSTYKTLAFYSFVCLLIQLLINTAYNIRLISAYNLLILFSYLYNCGQVWLTALGISLKPNSFTITYYSAESIVHALLIFLVTINALNIGGLVYRLIKTSDSQKITKTDNSKKHTPINNVNMVLVYFLFITCVIVLTYNDFKQISFALSLGGLGAEEVYALTYKIGRENPLIYLATYMYPASLFLFLFATKNKTFKKWVMLHAVLRSVALMLIIGSRMAYLPLLVCLLIYYTSVLKNKVSIKKVILIVACLGILYSTVSATRNNADKFDFQTISSYLTENNIAVDILQEMGSTQVDLILLYNNSPDHLPYAYGKSFLGSFLSLIPGGSSFIGDMENYIDLGAILNSYFHKGSSLGGSYIGELYYNFGYVILLFAPLIGCIFMSIENSITNRNKSSIMKQAMVFYLLYTSFIYVRGNVHDLLFGVKIIIYILILNFIFKVLFSKKKGRVPSHSGLSRVPRSVIK